MGLRSTTPRQSVLGESPKEAGSSGSRAGGAISAATVAVARFDEGARPPGIVKKGATTDSEIAMSSGEDGPSWSRANGRNSATVAVARFDEGARPPGIVKKGATTDSEIAMSSGEDGLLGPEQMAGTVPAYSSRLRLLVKLGPQGL